MAPQSASKLPRDKGGTAMKINSPQIVRQKRQSLRGGDVHGA
jgi:hypothetical protein